MPGQDNPHEGFSPDRFRSDHWPLVRIWPRTRRGVDNWPWFPGLDRGGLITGVLGLILGGLYLAPVSFQGKAVSLEADGQIPCASRRGQPMASCNFSRRRHTQGDTSLQVIHPNGMERELVFQGGTFTGCQIGHDGCGELIVELAREEQLHLLRVGNERYEIPGGLLQGR